MSFLKAIPCNIFTNQSLNNWCMESNAPYVITIGAVVACCLIARTCSAATRTLPAENKHEPKRLKDRVRGHSSQATSPRSQAIQLNKRVMEHLIKAGKLIGLQQLPSPADDGEDCLMFCLKELKVRKAAYFERSRRKPVSDEMSKIRSFELEFNSAIALCVEFFLGEKRFEQALASGLLAYPHQNHSIVAKLIIFSFESNALNQAEMVLVKMDPRSQRLDELWLQLGQKHLDQVPAQIEGAKRVLGKITGKEQTSLAASTAKKCLVIGEFAEGVDIVIGYLPSGEPRPEGRGMIWKGLRTPPKCSFELPGPKGPGFPFLDEINDSLCDQFVEKLIETGQIIKALNTVLTHFPEGSQLLA